MGGRPCRSPFARTHDLRPHRSPIKNEPISPTRTSNPRRTVARRPQISDSINMLWSNRPIPFALIQLRRPDASYRPSVYIVAAKPTQVHPLKELFCEILYRFLENTKSADIFKSNPWVGAFLSVPAPSPSMSESRTSKSRTTKQVTKVKHCLRGDSGYTCTPPIGARHEPMNLALVASDVGKLLHGGRIQARRMRECPGRD